jgi:exopolyphosphatase/guanosine-5'-triphosphate,3'-diphosphate pyrophosphatase
VPKNRSTLAAVDLGSNSFHLIVAQLKHDQLHVLDRLREMVRLAAGLDERNRLMPDARARALNCLERFGQRLRDFPLGSVRVVGTNTLRKTEDADDFIRDAEAAIGHPIEIISGVEEARLIYLGVSHSLPDAGGRRLVVDIGGGSTELIIGEGFEPMHLESLYMGCVSFSQQYFPQGVIAKSGWERAYIAARLELQPVEDGFRRLGWEGAAGASGTVRAIREVVQAEGWCDEGICMEGMRKLKKALLQADHVDRLELAGLAPERRAVFPGGVAILYAIFEALALESMRVSDGALREGLLYDSLGRIQHEDVRERTVSAMMQRHHVDEVHAMRVERCALDLWQQVRKAWKIGSSESRRLLRWAARLHEIGLVIAHSGHQKHGAYLLANSDLPGFSRREQRLLAALVRGSRRKFPAAAFKEHGKTAQRLCILLRLAILLHRGRMDSGFPQVRLEVDGYRIRLAFPEAWIEAHPLTLADLEREAAYLRVAKWDLQVQRLTVELEAAVD